MIIQDTRKGRNFNSTRGNDGLPVCQFANVKLQTSKIIRPWLFGLRIFHIYKGAAASRAFIGLFERKRKEREDDNSSLNIVLSSIREKWEVERVSAKNGKMIGLGIWRTREDYKIKMHPRGELGFFFGDCSPLMYWCIDTYSRHQQYARNEMV